MWDKSLNKVLDETNQALESILDKPLAELYLAKK
jgi:hypothetical protein